MPSGIEGNHEVGPYGWRREIAESLPSRRTKAALILVAIIVRR